MAQLRESKCDGVVAFGGGSVLDAAKAVALLAINPEQTLSAMTESSRGLGMAMSGKESRDQTVVR